FVSVTLLFALVAAGHVADNEGIFNFAGWVGLLCGASANYLAMGEVLNEQFAPTVLPIGEKHLTQCGARVPGTTSL
ncbi:acetate uptake transporter, partial [Enterobacter intestinihominis]